MVVARTSTRFKIVLFLITCIIIWRGWYHFKYLPQAVSLGANNSVQYGSMKHAVRVTVYYEALCSDSRSFILNHLVPSYDFFKGLIDLDLVPYGKAKTIEEPDNALNFHCQHGPNECVANKYHACAVDLIHDQKLQLQYVACMIKNNMLPSDIAESCASSLNIEYGEIPICANGPKGSILLKEFGIRTNKVQPSISFIPTIEFNGKQDVHLANILKDLKKELCNVIEPKYEYCP